MRFTVTYTRVAENQLAALWLHAADRKTVEQASNRIDRELATDPLGRGQDFGGPYRIISVAPLQALYHVRVNDRMVEVVALKRR